MTGKLFGKMFKKSLKMLFRPAMCHTEFSSRKTLKKGMKMLRDFLPALRAKLKCWNNLQGRHRAAGQAKEGQRRNMVRLLQRGPCSRPGRPGNTRTAQAGGEKQGVTAPLPVQEPKKNARRKQEKVKAAGRIDSGCETGDSSSNTFFLFIVFRISGEKGKNECCSEILKLCTQYLLP